MAGALLAVLGAVSGCGNGIVENDGPPPVEVMISIADASNTCVTHQTEKEKLTTCSDLKFLDPDGRVRVYDESGRQIGESPSASGSGWQDGELMSGWRFNVLTKSTTSRTLTITMHGCDLNGPRRGQAVVLRPTGSELAEGLSGNISPHTQAKLFLEAIDDPHTGQMRCQAATRPPPSSPS